MDSTQTVHGPPASYGLTSTSFLERLQSQDSQAWQQLADVYGPLVYFWCRQAHLQPADAADIAQDVFVATLAKASEFRRDRAGGSFRGWLWTIAQNKIRDRFRRQHEQAQGGTDAQQCLAQIPDSPEETMDAAPCSGDEGVLERRVLEIVRAGVEERTWQAFWRVTVDEQAVADVAEELGMTAAAVYKAKYRVARLIRQEMSALDV